MQKSILLLLLFFTACWQLAAQDEPKQITNTFLLQNATIIPSPGKMIEKGSVLIKDGVIQAVGPNVTAPFDAKVIKADSMYIYAGFISGASHVGIEKKKEENSGRRERAKNPGNPTYEKAGIQPDRMAREVLKADDVSISAMRGVGFTAAHAVPEGKMLPGKGAIVLLAGDNANQMILMENTALFAQLVGASGVAPATIIGVMSKMRDLYRQAAQSKSHGAQFASNPQGLMRPTSDPVLEAFYPVIEGKQKVFMKAQNGRDISRALQLQEDLGYQLALVDVEKGWNYLDQLKAHTIFLSLDLPKAKEEKKKDDEEEMSEGKKELEARRAEEQKRYEMQAKTFADAGVTYGFSTLEVKPKEVKAHLKRMMENGLTTDQALAALTTQAAQLLGVNKIMGSVEKGKMANLVITDAPYFEDDSDIRYVIVDGEVFEYEAKKKKKKKASGEAGEEKADIAGTWSYEMNVPGQELEGNFRFEVSEDEVKVFMSSPTGDDGEEMEIDDAELNGDVLTFSTSVDQGGTTLNLDFELNFDGESYEGNMSVGQFGTFDVEGSRTKKPE
ncbi:MAG: amidohydrolase family protein [Bacteroidota bacterium]